MPLVSIPVSQQVQAATSADSTFPQNPISRPGVRFTEKFDRETLTPSGAYTLYTTATTGAGTAVIAIVTALEMTTAAATGDDVSVRTSGLSFIRGGAANRR